MKRLVLACLTVCCFFISGCQGESAKKETAEKGKQSNSNLISDQTVEASCGECKFAMEGKGCDLAIRIDGKSYYVDGSKLDDHGDAHADDGMCNCVRKAKVTGEIKEGRFVATSFKLLPQDKKSNDKEPSAEKKPAEK